MSVARVTGRRVSALSGGGLERVGVRDRPLAGGPVARLRGAAPHSAAGVTTATACALCAKGPARGGGFRRLSAIPALAGRRWLLRVPRDDPLEHETACGAGQPEGVRPPGCTGLGLRHLAPPSLPSGVKGVHTGHHRAGLRAVRRYGSALRSPRAKGRSTFSSSGAARGARVLSKGVPKALARVARRMRQRPAFFRIRRGPEDAEEVERTYSRSGIACDVQETSSGTVGPSPFAQAQLVISGRSGASVGGPTSRSFGPAFDPDPLRGGGRGIHQTGGTPARVLLGAGGRSSSRRANLHPALAFRSTSSVF